jgi:L-malate glycosyltransferase
MPRQLVIPYLRAFSNHRCEAVKILVFAHRFDVGGSQVNAIDLATALRDVHGHEVVLFATPGPMVDVATARGLRFVPAPAVSTHPSLTMMRALRAVVARERPDVVHAWDWWQCLDAYHSVYLLDRVPLVLSDMVSEGVSRFLPKHLPTTFGTPALAAQAVAAGRSSVEVLLPPVDVQANRPDAVDGRLFRDEIGLGPDDVLVVTVSRLVKQLKSESLFRTIAAVRELGSRLPLKLALVGDGNAREELARAAGQVNGELGREAIVLTGQMLDPRAAYAGADIVVGMGGSALRGMAFAKPTIVVGEKGFSAPLTSRSADWFFHHGLYGVGSGLAGDNKLTEDIRCFATNPTDRLDAGAFGRDFVVSHFSVEVVCARLERLFRSCVAAGPAPLPVVMLDAARMWAIRHGNGWVPDRLRRAIRQREEQRVLAMHASGASGPVP